MIYVFWKYFIDQMNNNVFSSCKTFYEDYYMFVWNIFFCLSVFVYFSTWLAMCITLVWDAYMQPYHSSTATNLRPPPSVFLVRYPSTFLGLHDSFHITIFACKFFFLQLTPKISVSPQNFHFGAFQVTLIFIELKLCYYECL